MNQIKIEATQRTPYVDFDFDNHVFFIRGESYPEDVSAFYGPLMRALKSHLEGLRETAVRFDFELVYFNSSSAKILMAIFEALDTAALNNPVAIHWYYEEDDSNMEELGEEFGEDLKHATFTTIVKTESL